ncbi:MAG: cell division protein FtsL [Gammaproteobacteria bacterium]|nr:cell division protein FtsL [Gammaproteobacteria bacterium]
MRSSILVVLILASAVAVIGMRHQSRMNFGELQALRAERDMLNTEWGKLLLEEGAWSRHQRVEAAAQKRMGMALPGPQQVRIIERETNDSTK